MENQLPTVKITEVGNEQLFTIPDKGGVYLMTDRSYPMPEGSNVHSRMTIRLMDGEGKWVHPAVPEEVRGVFVHLLEDTEVLVIGELTISPKFTLREPDYKVVVVCLDGHDAFNIRHIMEDQQQIPTEFVDANFLFIWPNPQEPYQWSAHIQFDGAYAYSNCMYGTPVLTNPVIKESVAHMLRELDANGAVHITPASILYANVSTLAHYLSEAKKNFISHQQRQNEQ